MRKTIVVFVAMVGLCFGLQLHAAENPAESADMTWTFFSVDNQPTADELSTMTDGGFGKEATWLYRRLEKLCVKRVPVVPGDPTTRIVFRKGDLYNAVRCISKGLENDVEDKSITSDEAARRMERVLNVAISAFYSEDSSSFEKALRAGKKDYNKLLAVFDRAKLEE